MDKRRKTWVLLSAFSVLTIGVLLGVYEFYDYINGPSNAAHISNPTTNSVAQPANTTNTEDVTGTYADFSYPSEFKPLKQQPLTGNILATYQYDTHATLPWQLTITVNLLPNGSPNSDSAYYAMSQNPSQYGETTETINGASVYEFNYLNAGGYSKVACLFNGSHSADIALSSEDLENVSQEDAVLQQVVQSWQWN